MTTITDKSSADLEREIDDDRRRIENRIDAIQERMSPGQLIDEVIAYAKTSGGGEYVGQLGVALKANPLPVALIGISLAWLMAKGSPASPPTSQPHTSYPLYPVTGPVRRMGPPEKLDGATYSHFTDDTGKTLKALTDETGHRAGNFVDEAGKTYRGFVDSGGKQIESIVDETGAIFDTATGWAAEKWQQAKNVLNDAGARASDAASSLSDTSVSAATSLQQQTGKINELISTQFRDQPLIGGALAFAVGAAIGASLPHTDAEDDLVGEAADATKGQLSEQTHDLINQGKEVVSEVYGKAIGVAADSHDLIKDRVTTEVSASREQAPEGSRS